MKDLKDVRLLLLIEAYNDVWFVFTAFNRSFVIALHWLWPSWRTLLIELEAFADVSAFEAMLINSSGGSENELSKCLNALINLVSLKQNSVSNNFASSWWFEGQAFVDLQAILATYGPSNAHSNNTLAFPWWQ